jgi:hypothetical protein
MFSPEAVRIRNGPIVTSFQAQAAQFVNKNGGQERIKIEGSEDPAALVA